MNEMHHSKTGSMSALGSTTRSAAPRTRLKRAAVLTGIGVVVVVSMVGWLGGLALLVLEFCDILFAS